VVSEWNLRSGIAYAVTDLEGRFVQADTRYAEILGYPVEELLTKQVADVTHPDDWQSNARLIEELARTGQPFSLRKRYVRRSGRAVWVEVRASMLCSRDAGGSLIAVCRPLPELDEPSRYAIQGSFKAGMLPEADRHVLVRSFDRIAESRALLDRTERWLR
jgi:PAS domain S-box-containing protein